MRNFALVLLALALLIPLTGVGNYPLHLMVMGLLWSYIYTSWAIMGRLGMVSFGHGAFLGIGAYSVVLLWNFFGLSPWLGLLAGIAIAAVVALVIGYPCFRFKIVGHYFALVTLALSEVTRYTGVRFEFEDEQVAQIRVGGFYKANDIEGLTRSLQQNLPIRTTQVAPDRIVISSK